MEPNSVNFSAKSLGDQNIVHEKLTVLLSFVEYDALIASHEGSSTGESGYFVSGLGQSKCLRVCGDAHSSRWGIFVARHCFWEHLLQFEGF